MPPQALNAKFKTKRGLHSWTRFIVDSCITAQEVLLKVIGLQYRRKHWLVCSPISLIGHDAKLPSVVRNYNVISTPVPQPDILTMTESEQPQRTQGTSRNGMIIRLVTLLAVRVPSVSTWVAWSSAHLPIFLQASKLNVSRIECPPKSGGRAKRCNTFGPRNYISNVVSREWEKNTAEKARCHKSR